ncbi:hypothetical protein KY316_01080, partial [Candidatus Woesearchaeota archaeon]|nr:hypothetical protein [Candidatus Woesearchaeota archaeon]
CSKCEQPKVMVGDKCCIDADSDFFCDIDEAVQERQQQQQPEQVVLDDSDENAVEDIAEGINTTEENSTADDAINASEPVVYTQDCSNTKLSYARMSYTDGGNASIKVVFSNSGHVNITDVQIQVYNDVGKKIDNKFDLELAPSEADQFIFNLGKKNIVDEDNSVTMIKYAPIIAKGTCGFTTVYASSSIDIYDS